MRIRSILGGTVLSALVAVALVPAPAGAQLGICPPKPKPTITIGDTFVFEGSVANLPVTLSNSFCSNVTVNYSTVNGTAVAPADYVPAVGVKLTFTPGQTSQNAQVQVKCDGPAPDLPVEDFKVRLHGAVNGTIVDPVGLVRVYNYYCTSTHQG